MKSIGTSLLLALLVTATLAASGDPCTDQCTDTVMVTQTFPNLDCSGSTSTFTEFVDYTEECSYDSTGSLITKQTCTPQKGFQLSFFPNSSFVNLTTCPVPENVISYSTQVGQCVSNTTAGTSAVYWCNTDDASASTATVLRPVDTTRPVIPAPTIPLIQDCSTDDGCPMGYGTVKAYGNSQCSGPPVFAGPANYLFYPYGAAKIGTCYLNNATASLSPAINLKATCSGNVFTLSIYAGGGCGPVSSTISAPKDTCVALGASYFKITCNSSTSLFIAPLLVIAALLSALLI